jgi:transcriptional/translational regulatory protein YebC/TACO1
VTLSELHYQPKEYPDLSDEQREEVTDFLRQLDDHADVHRIYAALR